MYQLTDEQRKRLENDFTYHPPVASQIDRYRDIREGARRYAEYLMESCPPSRELSLALTHLEECVMYANASIARNE